MTISQAELFFYKVLLCVSVIVWVWWSISGALFAIAAILDDIRDIERNHKCS